jgi:hypothetical protein
LLFYGRVHESEAEGGFREDRESTSPLGRFDAHRL